MDAELFKQVMMLCVILTGAVSAGTMVGFAAVMLVDEIEYRKQVREFANLCVDIIENEKS